ncbi:hypothetical protein ALO96_04057, partial [Pseudomonas savastanoi pv. glycinea]
GHLAVRTFNPSAPYPSPHNHNPNAKIAPLWCLNRSMWLFRIRLKIK